MAPSLHATLGEAARTAGLSLNEYCIRRLATAGPCHDDAVELISRAVTAAREGLVAIVLHGSWARGDATAESDVDVLIVVDSSVRLSRALYRVWDAEPVSWDGRPVDAHFVPTPDDDALSGLWAEVAINGRVLFDRDGRVPAHLVRVRRAIAEGRIIRRVVHGQPYWAEAA